ncbi:MAG TPA: YciI family protein [Steroidobacteraceae bacterium]|nr:YciI family protein [Steroidobacteraceae bacterium]
MKVLVFVKATPNSEKGLPPAEEMQQMFEEMGRYNERLVKAGVMKEGDGLKPSSAGKRIKFNEGKVTVIDGPFAETKELVAGYWVWEVKSVEEAVEWAKQCPNPMPGEEGVLEIRPCYGTEDFADLLPAEVEREARLRKIVEGQQKRAAKATRKPAKKAKAAPKRPPTRKRMAAKAKAKKKK